MVNTYLLQRLQGIQQGLMGLHASGSGMSAASKGREREGFVNQFLRACHPPIYRFGTGDITDSDNRRSGQIDQGDRIKSRMKSIGYAMVLASKCEV
jgi:hypothetical protein